MTATPRDEPVGLLPTHRTNRRSRLCLYAPKSAGRAGGLAVKRGALSPTSPKPSLLLPHCQMEPPPVFAVAPAILTGLGRHESCQGFTSSRLPNVVAPPCSLAALLLVTPDFRNLGPHPPAVAAPWSDIEAAAGPEKPKDALPNSVEF